MKHFGSSTIISNTKEVLLGITIEKDLKFEDHVDIFCQKPNALAHLGLFINVDKKGIIIVKAFTELQFGYFPLVWMFHNRSPNNKINRVHERALRITYNIKSPLFQNCLRSVTLPQYTLEKIKTRAT